MLDRLAAKLPFFGCMKRMLLVLGLAAALVCPEAWAQLKMKEGRATPASRAPAAAATPAAKAIPDRKFPMHSRVDEIDAAYKTFTHVNADGKRVKFVVTATTTIQQGDAPAKFEDIKVGDTVSGSRVKVSDTEYTVVKITKFGVVPKKAAPEKPQ
jgi:hypothetical protein